MTSENTNTASPEDLKMLNLRVNLIPFYVQGVHAGLKALDLGGKYHALDGVEIRVDGVEEPVHSTILAAYTQASSSMAAIYSRLLLEFMGLKVGGAPSQLRPIEKRTRRGDFGIEKFRGPDDTLLEKISPFVVEDFPDPTEVRDAWITTCDFAGQRLTHVTDDFKLNGLDVTLMLVRTFETIPQVVDRAFFNKFE